MTKGSHTTGTSFVLEALVDFPDDALTCGFPITPAHIDAMMARLAALGVQRVIWADYGDGHGGYLMPSGFCARAEANHPALNGLNQWRPYAQTLDVLGNPLRVAAEAAHRHGLEMYAYFKPYETGISWILPEGAPEGREWGRLPHRGGYLTWADPFVLAHPELRIKRRTDDVPACAWPQADRNPVVVAAPIHTIRLTKKDDRPTRIKKENLQLWTSDLNYRYVQRETSFTFTETVEPSPVGVHDNDGNLLTAQGVPVRVLTLAGLQLTDRYLVVTTDFTEGPGDFENAGDRLLQAFDAQGREIPGVYATGTAIWFPKMENFRTGGLCFDTGRGRQAMTLDLPNDSQQQCLEKIKCQGIIGFARGRNAYLPGALCETEPAVQEFWLANIREMLAAGVDGIEFRVENHSCHTDTPDDYGFNDVVLARTPRGTRDLAAAVAKIRGDAYSEFLRRAKQWIANAGRRMRVNLNVDWFRPAAGRPRSRRIAFPANIEFDWRGWVDDGLLDQAMLRMFEKPFAGIFGEDATAQEMLAACGRRQVPVTVNRYVSANHALLEEFQRVHADPRFSGFVLYETCSFLGFTPSGDCDLAHVLAGQPDAPAVRGKVENSRQVEQVCDYYAGKQSKP